MLGLLVAVVVVAAVWLGSESGLNFLLSQARQQVESTGGRFEVTGASGGLYRGVTFQRVVWSDGSMQVNASDVLTRWSLRSVLRREVVVPDISIGQLTVHLPPSTEPAAPRTEALAFPARIGLPVSFELSRFRLDNLKIINAADGLDPGVAEPLQFTDIRFGLDYQEGAYNLRQLQAGLPWGKVSQTRLSLNDTEPHAVVLRGRFDGAIDAHPLSISLAALGSIKGLNASVKGDFDRSPVSVDVRLRPLEPNPVVSASGWIRQLDLGRIEPGLPKTAIDLDVDLLNPRALPRVENRPDNAGGAAAVAGQPDGGSAAWQGTVSISNAASGPWHERQLPLRSLSAGLQLDATAQSEPTRLTLSKLKIEMPGAKSQATISGDVEVLLNENHRVAGSTLPVVVAGLQFRNIDVAQFVDSASPTAMNGGFDLTRNLFRLDLAQSEGPLRQAVSLPGGGKAAVRTSGRISDQALHLDSALVQIAKSQLTVSGRATLAEPIELALGGSLSGVDLNTWLPRGMNIDERLRDGRINADWSVNGVVSPSVDAKLSLNLKQSSLMGHPLSGRVNGQVSLAGDIQSLRVRGTDSQLRLGSNVISLRGNLGQRGDVLTLSGLLADPGLIDPRASGSVRLKTIITGTDGGLLADASLQSPQLQWRGEDGAVLAMRATRVSAQLPLVTQFDDNVPVNLDIESSRISAAGQDFDAVSLKVSGTAAGHRIDAGVRASGHRVSLGAAGRLQSGDQPGWTGTLETLRSRGKVRAQLQKPVALTASAQGVRVGQVDLRILDGRLNVNRFTFAAPGAIEISGALDALPVGELASLAAQPGDGGVPPALSRLRLGASFDLQGTGTNDLTGFLNLALSEMASTRGARRESGTALGLSGGNGARIKLDKGKLDGTVDLTLPSLAFTRQFTGEDWVVNGELKLDGTLAGTVVSPRWNAEVTGSDLSLFQPALGWRFSRGKLSARVANDALTLWTLSLQSGDGRVTLSGDARLLDAATKLAPGAVPLDGRFTLRCDGLVLPIGPGQRMVLSGESVLTSSARGMDWTGSMRADEGLIEIAGSGAPALPDDVQVLEADDTGRAPRARPVNTPAKKDLAGRVNPDSPLVRSNLKVDLGEKLRITGGGVNARLTGQLNLLGDLPNAPRVTGEVIIRDGTYNAYSQELVIERGAVRFAGPLDNPLLDIVAIRPDLPVKAGVAIGGTALSPRVQLTSTPPLSDAETLSWVVLGTPLSSAGAGAQSLALKQAAAAFVGGEDGSLSGGGLTDRIGLDVGFGYASETGQDQVVTDAGSPTGLPGSGSSGSVQANEKVFTLGKKLSNRLSVSYEKGLEGVWNLLRLQYEITNSLSLRAQTGSESALDLIYFFSFD